MKYLGYNKQKKTKEMWFLFTCWWCDGGARSKAGGHCSKYERESERAKKIKGCKRIQKW